MVNEPQTIDLPGGDILVLYGLSASPSDRGIIARLHPNRKSRWSVRASPDAAEDAFVGMTLEGDRIAADTFQGQKLSIDVKTGAVLSSTFVK